eukprot:CAMPEP_0197039944 /NCGR_PEP_ID=MMETSP1384-20130603/16708_1 /TAXON_ID=29189 /ORGANISM="Ammonia sp." /LENGTH=356 /DNA_ID=CAMNT_0042470619 /DNA_START=5 /DNA_END=1075 /DNA_ORIENTATION=+
MTDTATDGNPTTSHTVPKDEPPPPYSDNKPAAASEPAPDGEGEFGSPRKRIIWVGACILLYCILAFWYPVWYLDFLGDLCDLNSLYCDDSVTAGYAMMVLGLILAVIGVIVGYFAVSQGNKTLSYVATAGLGLGGVFYVLGALVLMAEVDDPEEIVLALLIANFVEVCIPAAVMIVLAVDVFNVFLNNERHRMLALTTVIYLVFGFMNAICYAYAANYETCTSTTSSLVGPYSVCVDNPLEGEMGCIAAGYFLIVFAAVIRLLMEFEVIAISNPATKVQIQLLVIVLLVIGTLVLCAGYWAYIDEAIAGGSDYGESQRKCLYMAFTLFMIGMCVINAIDMKIVQLWKTCQAAQAAT